jgi:Amt family ammonium transporter
MEMKRLFTYIALTAALAFGANALAQDKPAAPAADAKPAAAAPAEAAKPAAAAPAPAAAPAADAKPAEAPKPKVDKGDTAWMLIATALVILMTIPGLALFYAGMVRSKNVLSVLMQVFVCFCVIAVLWVIYGYSVAATPTSAGSRRCSCPE